MEISHGGKKKPWLHYVHNRTERRHKSYRNLDRAVNGELCFLLAVMLQCQHGHRRCFNVYVRLPMHLPDVCKQENPTGCFFPPQFTLRTFFSRLPWRPWLQPNGPQQSVRNLIVMTWETLLDVYAFISNNQCYFLQCYFFFYIFIFLCPETTLNSDPKAELGTL